MLGTCRDQEQTAWSIWKMQKPQRQPVTTHPAKSR